MLQLTLFIIVMPVSLSLSRRRPVVLHPVFIIPHPLLFVRKHSICIPDSFESLVSSLGRVLVRVECQGEFPVSFLELGVCGPFLAAQDLVIVFLTFNSEDILLVEL